MASKSKDAFRFKWINTSFCQGKWEPVESARGSSQSLILNFLEKIDADFAEQQFKIYKSKFLDYRFGLPGIREFPKDAKSYVDIDSGPVILQIGSAASIVGLRVMELYHDTVVAVAIRNELEAFGFPISENNKKKYLLGKWPMADAFIAWAHSLEKNRNHTFSTYQNWRISFQLYSLLGISFSMLLLMLNMVN